MTLSERGRARTLAAVVVVLTFAAGLTAGHALARAQLRPPGPQTAILRPTWDPASLLDSLSLSPEQRVRAESLFAGSEPRTRAVLNDVSERLRAISDSIDVELRAMLTPDQRRRLDSLRPTPRVIFKRKRLGDSGATIRVDTLVGGGKRP